MFMCQFLCVKFVAILGEGKKDEVCYSVQNKSKHTHMHARTCMCARPGKDRLQYSAAESHKSFNERIFQAQFITLRWLNMSGWQIVLELDEHQTCHSSDKIVSQPGLGAVTVRITCSWEKFLLTEIKYNCQNHLFLREASLDGNQIQLSESLVPERSFSWRKSNTTVRITCSWEKFLLTEIKYNCQNHLFLREVSLDGNQIQLSESLVPERSFSWWKSNTTVRITCSWEKFLWRKSNTTVRITCSWEKFLLTEIKYNCQNHLFLREVFLDGYQMQAEYIFSSPFKTHRRRVLLYKSSTKLLFVLDDEYYYEWVNVTAIKNVILMRSCWVIFVCVHVFRGFVCVKLCL